MNPAERKTAAGSARTCSERLCPASLFLLTLVLLSSPLLHGEGTRFSQLTMTDGLSQNNALALFQDSRGFIWIGTESGLNRYDGYSFTQYGHNPVDSTSLSDNTVLQIVEDNIGHIWVSVLGGGLNVLLREQDSFLRLLADSSTPIPLTANRMLGLCSDSRGGLLAGSADGVIYPVPPGSDTLFLRDRWRIGIQNGLKVSGQLILSLTEGSDGTIWAGTEGDGLIALRREGGGLRLDKKFLRGIGERKILCIEESASIPGSLWLGTDRGLLLFDPASGQAISPAVVGNAAADLKTALVRTVVEPEPGTLLAGTGRSGLLELNLKKRSVSRFRNDPANPQSLAGNAVPSLLRDRSGLVWIGTVSGISRSLRDAYPFRLVRGVPDDPEGLRDGDVTALAEDSSGHLWVGTRRGGLHRSIRRGDRSRFIRYPFGTGVAGDLPDPYVKAIHQDRAGRLWVGIWSPDGGLFMANETQTGFLPYQHNPLREASLLSNRVRVIRDDENGALWVGTTNGGLSRLRPGEDPPQFDHFVPIPGDSLSLSMDDVFSIHLSDHEGRRELWVATYWGGLNRYVESTGTFTRYRFDPENRFSLPDDRAWTLHEDRHGGLWVGTHSGLAYLGPEERESGKFRRIGVKDGLPGDLVLGILPGNGDKLWISTLGALSRYDPATGQFSNFLPGDDLPVHEFNLNAACRSGTGELFFGASPGFIHFHPDSIRINTTVPPIVFTSFRVFEKPMATDSVIMEKRHLILSHLENFISFEFAALDFRASRRNQYAYMLEGLNEEWVQAGTRRYVTFSNLEPGTYRLRVRGSNNDGVWNMEGRSLLITITPPFWETVWFRVVLFVAAAALIVALIRFFSEQRLRRKLREFEIKQRVQEERERISSDLHDHIGAHLTNLATGLEVSRRYVAEAQTGPVEENLSYLEGYTRSTIAALRETIWSIREDAQSFGSLSQKVQEFLDSLARVDTTTALESSFEGDPSAVVTSEQALNIYRICQEGVTNALKHASSKTIVLRLTMGERDLCLLISDDGKGFDPSGPSEQHGYGLAGMARRADRLGGKFRLLSSSDRGTTIEARFER